MAAELANLKFEKEKGDRESKRDRPFKADKRQGNGGTPGAPIGQA
jgi:hypothetical protein